MRFWVSWYEPTGSPDKGARGVVDGPPFFWWDTGRGADDSTRTLCALVDAADEDSAKDLVGRWFSPRGWRFCDEKPAGWPHGKALICNAREGRGPFDLLLFHDGVTLPDPVHLALAADLAEARAEVAALRDHLAALRADAALLAEWRKWREERRAAKVRAYSLESEILRGDALRAVWNRLAVARAAVRAIEARMLATATAETKGGEG